MAFTREHWSMAAYNIMHGSLVQHPAIACDNVLPCVNSMRSVFHSNWFHKEWIHLGNRNYSDGMSSFSLPLVKLFFFYSKLLLKYCKNAPTQKGYIACYRSSAVVCRPNEASVSSACWCQYTTHHQKLLSHSKFIDLRCPRALHCPGLL